MTGRGKMDPAIDRLPPLVREAVMRIGKVANIAVLPDATLMIDFETGKGWVELAEVHALKEHVGRECWGDIQTALRESERAVEFEQVCPKPAQGFLHLQSGSWDLRNEMGLRVLGLRRDFKEVVFTDSKILPYFERLSYGVSNDLVVRISGLLVGEEHAYVCSERPLLLVHPRCGMPNPVVVAVETAHHTYVMGVDVRRKGFDAPFELRRYDPGFRYIVLPDDTGHRALYQPKS